VPGVYTDWPSAQKQIIGWTKPKHKCFASRAEAEAYVKDSGANGNPNVGKKPIAKTEVTTSSTRESQGATREANRISKKRKRSDPAIDNSQSACQTQFAGALDPCSEEGLSTVDVGVDIVEQKVDPHKRAKTKPTQMKGGVLRIYTDGSSLGNGKYGASAGVGVYFGADDAR
jgi:ribonuclease HI